MSKLEYKILNDISTKERFVKSIMIFSAIIVVGTILASVLGNKHTAIELFKESRKKQLVLANDHLLTTYLTDNLDNNIELESKIFLKRFHNLLFGLYPNNQLMKEQIEEVLTYGDKSIYIVVNQMQATSYFKTNITNGYVIKPLISNTDISIDFTSIPYKFKIATQIRTMKKENYEFKKLETMGYLKTLPIDNQNEKRFAISDFIVTDFSKISEISINDYLREKENNKK